MDGIDAEFKRVERWQGILSGQRQQGALFR
jgi:hypothetical protein